MANTKVQNIATEVTIVTDSDYGYLVSSMPTTPVDSKILGKNLFSGWIGAAAWAYASASTFTISGDQTAVYTKGVRVRWTQTTVKYGVVASSAYSAPNTTVTIVVNTSYTVANAAITARAYSFLDNPLDWPDWFDYVPVWGSAGGTGVTIGNAVVLARYSLSKKTCTYKISATFGSTTTYGAGASWWTLSLPVTNASNVSGMGHYNDFSGSFFSGMIFHGGSGAQNALGCLSSFIAATVPITWAVNDIIRINGVYEW